MHTSLNREIIRIVIITITTRTKEGSQSWTHLKSLSACCTSPSSLSPEDTSNILKLEALRYKSINQRIEDDLCGNFSGFCHFTRWQNRLRIEKAKKKTILKWKSVKLTEQLFSQGKIIIWTFFSDDKHSYYIRVRKAMELRIALLCRCGSDKQDRSWCGKNWIESKHRVMV